MTDYGITNPRTSLDYFRRTVLGPAPAGPGPDPLAGDRAPVLYYLGGRAGVWRSPTLYGRTQVSQQQAGYGCDGGARALTPVGLVWGQTASSFAAARVFSYPTDCVTYGSPKDLGSYGIANPFTVINSWAGPDQHYYRFTFTDTGRISLNNTIASSVTGVTYSVRLSVSGGAEVFSLNCEYDLGTNSTYMTNYGSISGSSTSGGIKWPLAAGTYDLWLVRYDSNYDLPNWPAGSTYTMALDFLAPVPGTSVATALSLGNQTAGVAIAYSGSMAANESNHYFKFTAVGSGNRTVTLTGLSCDYDLALLNTSGTQLASSAAGGSSSEALTYNCAASTTYIVKVTNYAAAASNYTVTIT